MSHLPIGDYALISDCRSAALVSRTGSIDWLCFPRFDGPSVFGRLLDERAGHWVIKAGDGAKTERRYLGETMVLETVFRTAEGEARLVDALLVGKNEKGHQLGASSPGVVVRRLTGVRGALEFELEYAPRPEYGLIDPLLSPVSGGIATRGGADILLLSAPTELQIDGGVARSRFRVREGETLSFALQHRASWEPRLRAWSQDAIAERLEDTISAWLTWS